MLKVEFIQSFGHFQNFISYISEANGCPIYPYGDIRKEILFRIRQMKKKKYRLVSIIFQYVINTNAMVIFSIKIFLTRSYNQANKGKVSKNERNKIKFDKNGTEKPNSKFMDFKVESY